MMTKSKATEQLDAAGLLASWEHELAAIDARRAELVIGIGMLRRTLGLPEENAGGPSPSRRTASRPRAHDEDQRPYLGMNILDAAKLYLLRVKEPKTPSDIAEAIKHGGVHSKSDDFPGVVRTTLSRKGKAAGIESFGGTLWGLSAWRPGRAKGSPQAEEGEPSGSE